MLAAMIRDELMSMESASKVSPIGVLQWLRSRPGLEPLWRFPQNPSPGDWLFHATNWRGLMTPAIAAQLPWLYRWFDRYTQLYFQLTGTEYLWGGKALFRAIATLSQRLHRYDYLTLQLGDYGVTLDPVDPRLFAVIRELTSPTSDVQVLASLLAEGDTLIDVGANHGSFAIAASHLVGGGGCVVAIEPQPQLAEAVRRSLQANAASPYQVYATAVGDREGVIDFFRPQCTSGSAGLYANHSATHAYSTLTVPIKPIDQLLDWQKLPGKILIKLDIEGSEYAFLKGATQLIQTRKPNLIVEVHPKTLAIAGQSDQDLMQLLQKLGYASYSELSNVQVKLPLTQLAMNWQRNIIVWMPHAD